MECSVDVGVLLSRGTLGKITKGRLSYESIELYDCFARQIGLRPIFFSPEGLSPQSWQVKGVVRSASGNYRRVVLPIPSVIHNRIKPPQLPSALKEVQGKEDGFGCSTRTTVLISGEVYALLCGTPRLKEHVPETDRVSPDTVVSLLQKYPQI